MSLKNSLKHRKAGYVDLTFCFDRPLVEDLELARSADAEANEGRLSQGKSARTKELERAVKAASATIRIKSLPWGDYNALLLEHPAREGREEAFNPETFFVAAAKATAVEVTAKSEVPIPDEDWDEFIAGLTDGEYDRLANAVGLVNRDVSAAQITPFV